MPPLRIWLGNPPIAYNHVSREGEWMKFLRELLTDGGSVVVSYRFEVYSDNGGHEKIAEGSWDGKPETFDDAFGILKDRSTDVQVIALWGDITRAHLVHRFHSNIE